MGQMKTGSVVRGLEKVLSKGAGKHLGDMVWSEIEDVESRGFSREALRDALDRHGLPKKLAPEEVGEQTALGRARNDAQDFVLGYRFEALEKRSRDYHLFRAEGKGIGGQKITCAVITLDEHDKLTIEENPHTMDDNARKSLTYMKERYDWHLSYVSYQDVSAMLRRALNEELMGTSLKRTGHLYWVPAVKHSEVRALREVFEELHSRITVMPVYDTPEARAEAARGVKDGLDNEIKKLFQLLEAYKNNGKEVRESTVQHRLDEVSALRVRVNSMTEILGQHTKSLLHTLIEAEAQARALVEVSFDEDDSNPTAAEANAG